MIIWHLYSLALQLSYQETPDRISAIFDGGGEILTQEYVSIKTSVTLLQSVEIGKGITEIGTNCFKGFKALKNLIINIGCTKLSQSCFEVCSSLAEVHLPDGLVYLGDSCFRDDVELKSVRFPASFVGTIASNTFRNCKKLVNITVAPGNPIYSHSYDNSLLIYNETSAVIGSANETVRIPKEITRIKSYCFYFRTNFHYLEFDMGSKLEILESMFVCNCNLKRIVFPHGLRIIENNGIFSNGVIIDYIFLPNTLTDFGNIFDQSITEVEVEENLSIVSVKETKEIYNKEETKLLYAPLSIKTLNVTANLEQVPYKALRSSSSLSEIYVNSSNQNYSVYDGILYTFGHLVLILCPMWLPGARVHSNCVKIDDNVFNSRNLSRLTFDGSSMTTIGRAFKNTKQLKSLILPDRISSISDYCFVGSGLESIKLPSALDRINHHLFDGCLLSAIDMENCTKIFTIYDGGFSGCSLLKTVVLPPVLQTISLSAFENCKLLESISFPNNLKTIGSKAFMNCIRLKTITFEGNEVVSILDQAFYRCNITGVLRLPESLKNLEQESFKDNKFITEVDFGSNPLLQKIEAEVFSGNDLIEEIYIGEKVTEISAGAFAGMNGLKGFEVSAQSSKYECDRGVLHTKGLETLVAYPFGLQSFEINSSVAKIGERAFMECESLQSISFSSDSRLESIGTFTFYKCIGLKSIEFPGSVSTLSGSAFSGCSELITIKFLCQKGSGKSLIKTLESSCFENCKTLERVIFVGESNLESIGSKAFFGCVKLSVFTFSTKIKKIGSEAFCGCSLLNVNFSSLLNVQEIGFKCFSGCLKISSVKFGKDLKSIGDLSFDGCTELKTILYCGNNTISSDAFGGLTPNVFVTEDYQSNRFCRIQISSVLDNECNFPTRQFTNNVAHIESDFIFIFASSVSNADDGLSED